MKNIIIIVLLFISSTLFSQNDKIVKLLNKQLNTEYKEYYDQADKERFKLTQPYKIDENGILSFSFTENYNQYNGKTNYYREIPIDKIVRLDKDMNVVFISDEKNALEIVTTYDNQGKLVRENKYQSTVFQTEIKKEQQNEYFRDELIKAFNKAGYEIKSEYWWD